MSWQTGVLSGLAVISGGSTQYNFGRAPGSKFFQFQAVFGKIAVPWSYETCLYVGHQGLITCWGTEFVCLSEPTITMSLNILESIESQTIKQKLINILEV